MPCHSVKLYCGGYGSRRPGKAVLSMKTQTNLIQGMPVNVLLHVHCIPNPLHNVSRLRPYITRCTMWHRPWDTDIAFLCTACESLSAGPSDSSQTKIYLFQHKSFQTDADWLQTARVPEYMHCHPSAVRGQPLYRPCAMQPGLLISLVL